jgi:uncharacterized repeat protein (TIGR03847 family)
VSDVELSQPDRFTAGAVGEPGARVFYLQASEGGAVVSLRLEKQQVGALGLYLQGVLSDLPAVPPDELPTELDLVEPIVPEWVVGTLSVAYDDDEDRIVLQAEELVDEDDDGEPVEVPSRARFHLTRAQVVAYCAHAEELVAAGRPPCPICGQPMDPDGHVCPRSNGHH